MSSSGEILAGLRVIEGSAFVAAPSTARSIRRPVFPDQHALAGVAGIELACERIALDAGEIARLHDAEVVAPA